MSIATTTAAAVLPVIAIGQLVKRIINHDIYVVEFLMWLVRFLSYAALLVFIVSGNLPETWVRFVLLTAVSVITLTEMIFEELPQIIANIISLMCILVIMYACMDMVTMAADILLVTAILRFGDHVLMPAAHCEDVPFREDAIVSFIRFVLCLAMFIFAVSGNFPDTYVRLLFPTAVAGISLCSLVRYRIPTDIVNLICTGVIIYGIF